LKPLNIGLSSAWKKATSRETWRSVVDKARVCHEKKKNSVVHVYHYGVRYRLSMLSVHACFSILCVYCIRPNCIVYTGLCSEIVIYSINFIR